MHSLMDENRIDRILMHLADYWHKYPNLNLTQVIVQVTHGFDMNDDDLLDNILHALEEDEDDESCY